MLWIANPRAGRYMQTATRTRVAHDDGLMNVEYFQKKFDISREVPGVELHTDCPCPASPIAFWEGLGACERVM